MLEKLLSEIRYGGTFEINILASKLKMTPGLVKAMLSHLQQLGYIQSYHPCNDACTGCNLSSECRPAKGLAITSGESPLYVLVETLSTEKA